MEPTVTLPRKPAPLPAKEELLHRSRQRVVFASAAQMTATDADFFRELDETGWHRLSRPAATRVREAIPNERRGCVVYEVSGLRRPDAPLAAHGVYYVDAVQHAKDLGDAVVISIEEDGTIEALYASATVTVERLFEAARCSSPDAWRIVAALLELLAMKQQEFRLSPAHAAQLREGHDPSRPAHLLYRWQDLRRPMQVYPSTAFEYAERRAHRYDHLLVSLEPDGRIFGFETGPGGNVSFDEVLEEAERIAQGEPVADALAVLGAILDVWHGETARDLTKHNFGDDVALGDIPEDDLLIHVRRRYAARREIEEGHGLLWGLPGTVAA
ncbi:MAG: hypothetical protein KF849_15365 [Rhizobiaceae bacterium]|nr:hypothetical protein [Rhizobiaceae bacterium]